MYTAFIANKLHHPRLFEIFCAQTDKETLRQRPGSRCIAVFCSI